MLRPMITLLMLVIILPWGAYVAAAQARPHGIDRATIWVTDAVGTPADRATLPDESPTKVSAPRKCRTGILPGFSCNPDPAMQSAMLLLWQEPLHAAFPPAGQKTDRGPSEPPPDHPPRLF